jgi:hypothetical protein
MLFKPFQFTAQNNLEIVNETLVYLITLSFLPFLDAYSVQYDDKMVLGIVTLASLSGYVVVNLIYVTITSIRQSIRLWNLRKQRRLALEK